MGEAMPGAQVKIVRVPAAGAVSKMIDMDPTLWEAFKARARKNQLTVSGLTSILVRDFLSNKDPVWVRVELK
jgi:hypothetical protein